MEEHNDSEQVTGSTTASESGFVHVESVDSAGSSINQDDGVVVTSVQYDSSDLSDSRMMEDGGNEEFVDCPDDLVSYDGRTDFDETQESEIAPESQLRFGENTEILPHHYQEERRQLLTELTKLRHQLKNLIKKHSLIGGNDDGLYTDEVASSLPLHEMISDCFKFIELALSEQLQTEGTLRDLYAILHTKDREIEDLNRKVTEGSSIETVADRILSIFATVFGEVEFQDASVSGKMFHLEKSTSILAERYIRFISEVEMLNQCLIEVKSGYHIQTDIDKVFFSAREELVSLKRKEFELAHKSSYLEIEYGKLMEQLQKSRETIEMLNSEIGKLKGEVEVQKTRFSNTKEKLNMAVTKGKSLVQQRDSLKQAIVEKTNELDKCLLELQEKSRALDAADSLKESLLQRNTVLEKCEEVLSLNGVGEELQSSDIIDCVRWLAKERNRLTLVSIEFQKVTNALSSLELPEAVQYPDFESQVIWLLESFNKAKHKSVCLQDEINAMKEIAHAVIDRLTVSVLAEAQEKNYLEEELTKISEEIRVLKDKNGSLQIDLQRSEDKAGLLREKLSMAVKKGKSLIQERESMKQQMAEKNALIEALHLELKQQETTMNDVKDHISKLESDVVHSKEERDQIEQFLIESNTILQHVIDAIGDINLPVDLVEPVEKVKWCATYFEECQVAKAKAEQELTDALTVMESLEDELSVSKRHVIQLTEEKRELEILNTSTEEELQKSFENELKNFKEKVAFHEQRLMDASATTKTLEDALLKAENTISDLVEVKKNFKQEISALNSQLSACRQELARKHENYYFDLSSFLDNLQLLLKDNTLLALFKQGFEKKFEIFVEINHHLKDIKNYFDSEQLQDYPAIEESSQLTLLPVDFDDVLNTETTDGNLADTKDISSYIDNTLEKLNSRNQILADGFIRFSTFIDELTASLLIKLESIRSSVQLMVEQNETLQKNVNNLQIEKQAQERRVVMLEHDIKILRSACADVTKEMKSLVEKNMLEKLSNPSLEIGADDDVAVADTEEMFSAARNVRSLIEHGVDVKWNMSTMIKELQAELDNTMSMYQKVKEENEIFQNRVIQLENEIEVNRAKEDELNKREANLSKQEAENDLISPAEVKRLFNKINGITIPFPNMRAGEIEANDSDPVKKLFYIVDSVNELLDQITLLSQSKQELHSTLSKQVLEIEHLKEEFEGTIYDKKDYEKVKKEVFELSNGFEHIIKKIGGDEDMKSADVAGLLRVLERLVNDIVLNSEKSKAEAEDLRITCEKSKGEAEDLRIACEKSKAEAEDLNITLLETQKLAKELEKKVNLHDDYYQNPASIPNTIQERGGTDASSFPSRSEISEVEEDQGSVGKRTPLLVPSAAHVRTLWRGSNEHLGINIDPESGHLIDKHETAEDKGHVFKSLHTSGFVPPKGKIVADRLDGIWVSGSRALMSRPRARLGLIFYWFILHIWLMGTIL